MWPFKPNIARMKRRRNVRGLVCLLADRRRYEYQLESRTVFQVRVAAAEALGDLKDSRAVEALLDAFTDSDEELRGEAAKALGKIGDARALGSMIGALDEKEFCIRLNAAWALGAIGDPRAAGPLLRALNDEYAVWGMQNDYGRGSGEIRETMTGAFLKTAGDNASALIIDALKKVGPVGKPGEDLLDILVRAGGDGALEGVLWAFHRFGFVSWHRGMQVTFPHPIERVINAMGSLGDKRAIEPLNKLLENPSLRSWFNTDVEGVADSIMETARRAIRSLEDGV